MTNGQISGKSTDKSGIGSMGGIGQWLAAMSLGLFLVLAPQAARAEGMAAPASSETAAATATAPEAAHQRQLHYAEREAAAPQAASFKGQGAGIYIGGSTLAIVLLIVLLVVLL